MKFNFHFKFYNDLTPILLKFQGKVNDFVFARKTEKDDLMKDIQSSLARPSSANRPAPQPAIPAPLRPPPPQAPSASSSSASYPTQQYPNPYYPMMPNTYNPYQYPEGGPPAGQIPQYPPQYQPNSGAGAYPPQYPQYPK